MGSLIVISWRDIPAQVIVKRGRESAKVQLSHRFQEAVDRAAMRAGKGSSDAYLADWARSVPRPCGTIYRPRRRRRRRASNRSSRTRTWNGWFARRVWTRIGSFLIPEPRQLPSPPDVRGQAMVGAPRARPECVLSRLSKRCWCVSIRCFGQWAMSASNGRWRTSRKPSKGSCSIAACAVNACSVQPECRAR